MKIFKKIICSVLALSMLLSVTGCADTKWVAKKGETIVTSGMYKGMLVNAFRQASLKITDLSVPLAEQEIESKNIYDWVKEEAQNDLQMYYGVTLKCDEMGVNLDQERIDSLSTSVQENWDQLELFDKNGCDVESYTALNLYSHKSNTLFEKIYGVGGEKEVAQEEILNYYQDQYARVKFIVMPKMTPDRNLLDEAGLNVLSKKAQAYLTRLQNGQSIDDLIKENNAYYNIGVQESQEEQNPDDNYYVMSKTDTQVPKEFVDKFFESAKVGEPALYDVENYFIVAIRYDLDTSTETMESYRNSLLWNIKGDEYEQEMINWAGDIEINEAAIKKYSPKKIKI